MVEKMKLYFYKMTKEPEWFGVCRGFCPKCKYAGYCAYDLKVMEGKVDEPER